MDTFFEQIQSQFHDKVKLVPKRPGIFQIIAPAFHEDGDMVEMFLEKSPSGGFRVSDHGMTLMRLSYQFELDTDRREEIFRRILAENLLQESEGRIFVDADPKDALETVFRFSHGIAKISNLKFLRKEFVRGLFLEMLSDFIDSALSKFNPQRGFAPLQERSELVVDYHFPFEKHPVFLFAVRGSDHARLATINFLSFKQAKIPFFGAVVHEDMDALPVKDRKIITSAADKQFYSLDDFQANGEEFLARQVA